MSTGLERPVTTGCTFTRTAALGDAGDVTPVVPGMGAPDVDVGSWQSSIVPPPSSTLMQWSAAGEVVVGDREIGAVECDAVGFALLLHAPMRAAAAAMSTTRRANIGWRLRPGSASSRSVPNGRQWRTSISMKSRVPEVR